MVPQATLSPKAKAWIRALAKAQARNIQPTALGSGHYDVPSSRGGTYRVVRLNVHCTRYSCNCPAGEEGQVCFHAASVAALPYEVAGRNAHRRRLARAAA